MSRRDAPTPSKLLGVAFAMLAVQCRASAAPPTAARVDVTAPGPGSGSERRPPGVERADPRDREQIARFVRAFNARSADELEAYVDGGTGLLVLDDHGRDYSATSYVSLADAIDHTGGLHPGLSKGVIADVAPGSLPSLECDDDRNGDGAFWGSDAQRYLPERPWWNELRGQSEEIQAAHHASRTATHYLYDTSTRMGFYFRRGGEGLVLVLLELGTRCSA